MVRPFELGRWEKRVPMTLAVHLCGNAETPGTETAFTENVSPRGVRVVSVRRWRANEDLDFVSLPGTFRARARVAYCQPLSGQGYAVGLEFLEQTGRWVVGGSSATGKSLHG
ncbi:MAG: PilZ domain-containing protein [Candidatus Acidiferrales bacterium]